MSQFPHLSLFLAPLVQINANLKATVSRLWRASRTPPSVLPRQQQHPAPSLWATPPKTKTSTPIILPARNSSTASIIVHMSTDIPATPALAALLSRAPPTADVVATANPPPAELDLAVLASALFPHTTYTPDEMVTVRQWTAAAASPDADFVGSLNAHLATRTTVLGTKPSVADVAVYAAMAPVVAGWSPEQRTGPEGWHHVVRLVDFVQNAPVFGLGLLEKDKVKIDLDDVRALPRPVKGAKEDNKKGKEKKGDKKGGGEKGGEGEQEVVVGQTKEASDKKAKQPKQKQAKPSPAPAAPPAVSAIDLRVGHILRAVNHPNADSLYVSTINVGDAPGSDNTHVDEATGQTVRTVCSGLNGLVPLAEMQNRKVAAVCNLKPVTMRGIKSCAMVLAASPKSDDAHAGPVELVSPPADAAPGTRLAFEGWTDGAPEKTLNPKKKVWETFQPGFTTTAALEVAFESAAVPAAQEAGANGRVGRLVTPTGEVCTVKSLAGAAVR